MKRDRIARSLALLPWILCACTSPAASEVPGLFGSGFPGQDGEKRTPAALYGWDGSVVEGQAPGQVTQRSNPGHGLEPTLEGRMHILELYQSVLDERDALASEVQALTKSLEKTDVDLSAARARAAELETKLASEVRARDELQRQNLELSGRLTTAQIRRLEAEKLLLETRIAWQKEKNPPPQPEVDAGS
jgi:hypothetical protein